MLRGSISRCQPLDLMLSTSLSGGLVLMEHTGWVGPYSYYLLESNNKFMIESVRMTLDTNVLVGNQGLQACKQQQGLQLCK